MPLWKTRELANALATATGMTATITPPGGDYDTEVIIIRPRSAEQTRDPVTGTVHSLFVSGFDPDRVMRNPSTAEVEMVELTDGRDSRGGLNSDDPKIIQAYADVFKVLKAHGFDVVPRMQNYF